VTRGWVFDLDGTLVDSLPGIATSLNAALAAAAQPQHDAAAVRRFIGDGAEMLVRRALAGADENAHAEVLQAFREHYAAHWQEGTIPYTGIRELLDALRARGDLLAVLSNKPHGFTTDIVDRLFPRAFVSVVGQKQGIPHKPDPAGLREIIAAPAWQANKTVIIGDSVMDLQTAQRAGISSIAVTWGYHDVPALEHERPDFLVQTVEELHRLLLGEDMPPSDQEIVRPSG
jgi:phosphoglycolate phosphatase